MAKRYALPCLIVGLILVLDATSKVWASKYLLDYSPCGMIGHLLAGKLVYNRAIAFSLMNDYVANSGTALIYIVNMAGLLVAIYFFRHTMDYGWKIGLPVAGMVAGALGNFIDRIINGAVTDFIVIHYYDIWYFPVFNVADMAVTVSGVIIAYRMIRFNEGLRPMQPATQLSI